MDATATRRPGVQDEARPARRRFADNERQLAVWFLLPSIVYALALVAVPFFLAIGFAFSDVTAGDPSFDWRGLQTFGRALDDPVFWRSLRNTFVFTAISMALIVVLGKVLANILMADFRGKWLVRFLVLLPWTTPVALSAVAWLWMLDSVFSPIDWVLRNLGLIEDNMYWLGRPHLAMASVIAVHVWRLTPLSAVIILAGLVAIPKDIDEAARVDGAGFWRRMFEVTIPLTLPVVAVAALFGAILTFTDMTVVYVLTRGGPNHATQVLASWAFIRGIEGGDVAQGAAVALFLFPLLLAAAIAILRAVRRMALLSAFVCAAPFLWSLVTAFKQNRDLYNPENNPFFFNLAATPDHVLYLLRDTAFVSFVWNTLWVGLLVVAITLPLGLPAAYSLARLDRPWSGPMAIAIFFVYLVPPSLLFLSLSRLVVEAGLQDSTWSLVLVYPPITIPVSVWLLVGFLKGIPKDVEEQAMVDGYSRLAAFVRVVLPLAFPGIVAVVVFAFTLTASEFIYALAFVSPTTEKVVSTGVPTELIRGDVFFWQSLQAATILVAVPIAFVFNAFLARFISGFTMG